MGFIANASHKDSFWTAATTCWCCTAAGRGRVFTCRERKILRLITFSPRPDHLYGDLSNRRSTWWSASGWPRSSKLSGASAVRICCCKFAPEYWMAIWRISFVAGIRDSARRIHNNRSFEKQDPPLFSALCRTHGKGLRFHRNRAGTRSSHLKARPTHRSCPTSR